MSKKQAKQEQKPESQPERQQPIQVANLTLGADGRLNLEWKGSPDDALVHLSRAADLLRTEIAVKAALKRLAGNVEAAE